MLNRRLGARLALGGVLALCALACQEKEASSPAPAPKNSQKPTGPESEPLSRKSRLVQAPRLRQHDSLRLASWNVAWLHSEIGRGSIPRTEEDYARLKSYVETWDFDVIALSEVHGPKAAARLFSPEIYEFHFAAGRAVQRVGFAFKRGLEVKRHADISQLAAGGLRAGVDLTVVTEDKAFRLLALHLKSGCFSQPLDQGKACKKLQRQIPLVEEWIDTREREGASFAVLGDFNRSLFRSGGDAVWHDWNDDEPPGLKLWSPTQGRESPCWGGKYPDYIDHLLINQRLSQHLLPDSFVTHLFSEAHRSQKKKLSDHCPLSVELRARFTTKSAPSPEAPSNHAAKWRAPRHSASPMPSPGPIKGNISRSGAKLYHRPDCPSYAATRISEDKGEAFFESIAEAEAAGFTVAGNCP